MDRTTPQPPSVVTLPKTVELEQRLARSEVTMAELREALAVKDGQIAALEDTIAALYRRVIALQAQVDHLSTKIGAY